MNAPAQATRIQAKTRELCQTILDDASFAEAITRIQAFTQDKEAQRLYGTWQERGRAMHQLTHHGHTPTEEDVAELERCKAAVINNPTALAFEEAENQLNSIFGDVMKWVQTTLQKGRMPTEEDFASSGCCGGGGGGGCGCH
ncbi:MAG: YlbF family regulator [Verrucomicrobiota bacterium]